MPCCKNCKNGKKCDRKNWMGRVAAKIKKDGTGGAFTDWCNKKGYRSVHACAVATKSQYDNQKWRKASNPREALRDYRRASLALVFEKAAKKTKGERWSDKKK